MKASIQKILAIFCLVMAFASLGYANDRERVFIDANGSTGYYVYMDNVKRPSYYEIIADIAIIKADDDRLFVYETYFDTYHNTCRFQTSKVYKYSDKQMLMGSNTPQELRGYTPSSPIKAIADYLVENTKNLIPAGALPIPPGEEENGENGEGTVKPNTKPGVNKPTEKKPVPQKTESKQTANSQQNEVKSGEKNSDTAKTPSQKSESQAKEKQSPSTQTDEDRDDEVE